MLLETAAPCGLATNFQIGINGTLLGETVQHPADLHFIPTAGPEKPAIDMLSIEWPAEGMQQPAMEDRMSCVQFIAASAGCAASSTASANATNWNTFFITLMMGAIDTRRL